MRFVVTGAAGFGCGMACWRRPACAEAGKEH